MAQVFNLSNLEAEAGGSQSQPGLQTEYQASQGFTEKACLKKSQNKAKQWQKHHSISNERKVSGSVLLTVLAVYFLYHNYA